MKKVLIVEDLEKYQSKFAAELAGKVSVLQAFTLYHGLALFEEHKDELAAIAMDACVPGDRPNSFGLVCKMRLAGFSGPMIAISSLYEYRQELMRAGCDHQCPKDDLPKVLLSILGG